MSEGTEFGSAAAPIDVVTTRQLRTATTALLVTCLVCCLVLIATGLLLVFSYKPSHALFGPAPSAWSLANILRVVHRSFAYALLLATVALGIVSAIRSSAGLPARRALRIAVAGGAFLLILVTWFTGFFLPFDNIAFWSVRVGSDMRGFLPLLNSSQVPVRFVVVGSEEVGAPTIVRWFWVHIALGGLATAVFTAVTVLQIAARRARPTDV